MTDPDCDALAVRPARPEDCADIASLFLLSSDGLAEYIWAQVAEDGESLQETGRRRYAREGVAFSYQNCLVAERQGKVVAMLHSFPMPPRPAAPDPAAPRAAAAAGPARRAAAPGARFIR